MLTYALEQLGYGVISATGGNQALEIFERNSNVSLMLLDLRMPDRGGMEVLKEVRTRNPQMGVIMLTAVSDREIARQAITLGAFDYLVKPINLLTLESVMGACLSHTEYQQRRWWKRFVS